MMAYVIWKYIKFKQKQKENPNILAKQAFLNVISFVWGCMEV